MDQLEGGRMPDRYFTDREAELARLGLDAEDDDDWAKPDYELKQQVWDGTSYADYEGE